MNNQNNVLVTETQIEHFEQDGVICLRNVFDTAWLEVLARGVERNFDDPGPDHTVYTEAGKPGGFYDDYCNWRRIPEYQEFLSQSPAAEIAGRLTRSNSARIYHEHVLVKEPGTQEVTPWHHDLPYYGVDGDQLCSIWLPLDPVAKDVCPEFVSGSHNWGKLFYPRLFVNHSNYADGFEGFETVPEIDKQRDKLKLLSWEMQAGDCIVFHMRTLHGAPATTHAKTRRRGFSTRWMGDDAKFAIRPWKTSPPFPEVTLQPGDAMHHDSFPAMWSSG